MDKGKLLESWKEISAYLNRSPKTCQRWETELGLPVHRLDGTPKARVFAYTDELDRWLGEKLGDPLLEAKEEAASGGRGRGLRRFLLPALGLIGATVIGFGIRHLVRIPKGGEGPAGPPSQAGRRSLAVLPFTNNTGNPALDHWQDMLADLCAVDLCQSRLLHVLTSERVCGALEKLGLAGKGKFSIEDLRKVAAETGIEYVMTGGYAVAGDRFIISVTIQDPLTLDDIGRFEKSGSGDASIPDLVDGITRSVKSGLGFSDDVIATDTDEPIVDIRTTPSPDALRLYIEAVGLRYRGRFEESLELLAAAVRIDPDFAMAYRQINLINMQLGHFREAGKAYDKALELSERLPLKERLFIQAQQTSIPWTERIGTFEKLLTYYPEHEDSLCLLGFFYQLIEDRDKAIDCLERCLGLNKEYFQCYGYLAAPYRAKGLYDEADRVLKAGEANVGERPDFSAGLGLTHACRGKYELALSEIRKADALLENKPLLWLLEANVHYLAEDFARAEGIYREMTRSGYPRLRYQGRYMLGNLYLSLGRFEQAKAEIDEAIKEGESQKMGLWPISAGIFRAFVDVESGNVREGREFFDEYLGSKRIPDSKWNGHVRFWRAMFSLAQGEVDEAERAFEVFEGEIERASNPGFRERTSLAFQGAIELKKGNSAEAVRLLERAASLLPSQHFLGFEPSGIYMARETDPHCMYLSLLASAYDQDGRIEKARDTYERITRLTTGRLWDGHKYAKAFYRLGRIYEEQGRPGKAMDSYERFLELWRDADPGIPEIEDTRLRLSGLKARARARPSGPLPD